MPRQEEAFESSTNEVDTSKPRGLVASTNRPRPMEGVSLSLGTGRPGRSDVPLDGEGAVVTQDARFRGARSDTSITSIVSTARAPSLRRARHGCAQTTEQLTN